MYECRDFENILQDYFRGTTISNGIVLNPKVTFLEFKAASWRNLWDESAVYRFENLRKTYQGSSFMEFDVLYLGKLVIRERKDFLLVNLLREKSRFNSKVLVLEDFFKVPLN